MEVGVRDLKQQVEFLKFKLPEFNKDKFIIIDDWIMFYGRPRMEDHAYHFSCFVKIWENVGNFIPAYANESNVCSGCNAIYPKNKIETLMKMRNI